MRIALIFYILLVSFSVQAQFSTGIFTDKKTQTTYRYITAAGLDWMQDDVTVPQPDTADILATGQRFIKKKSIQKFCPKGWRLPTLNEVRQLITILEGEKNSTGGKTLDSAYLQTIFPFSFNGIYFTSRKGIMGTGYMTAFYTATDTLSTFRESTQPAQVAIHIYSAGRRKVNFEPTFSQQLMYCRLRFVRDTKASEK